MRALTHIRYRDEPVSFENYGEYAVLSGATSPVRELLTTLTWLGPHARGVLRELESLRTQRGGLSKKLRVEVDRAIEAIRSADHAGEVGAHTCCAPPRSGKHIFLDAKFPAKPCAGRVNRFRGPSRRVDYVPRILLRAPLDRRLLLHALRQPAEVLAHDYEARPNSEVVGGTGTRRANTHGSDYVRSGVRSSRTPSRLWAEPQPSHGCPSSNAQSD